MWPLSGTRGAAWSPHFSDGQARPCSGFCDGPHWCRGARGAPSQPALPRGRLSQPLPPVRDEGAVAGPQAACHGRRVTSGHLPSTACFSSPAGPLGPAVWGQSVALTPPWGKTRGAGPPPSLLDGPSTMLRPRQGDSPLRAACICPLCEAVGAAELTPRCRVLQFFYSASPASPQPPGT